MYLCDLWANNWCSLSLCIKLGKCMSLNGAARLPRNPQFTINRSEAYFLKEEMKQIKTFRVTSLSFHLILQPEKAYYKLTTLYLNKENYEERLNMRFVLCVRALQIMMPELPYICINKASAFINFIPPWIFFTCVLNRSILFQANKMLILFVKHDNWDLDVMFNLQIKFLIQYYPPYAIYCFQVKQMYFYTGSTY